MARRGRPTRSEIRENIVEILAIRKPLYGYRIHKFYNELFPACTREVIYYNLRKGVSLKEFVLVDVRQETGEYSWGQVVEKKYYKLGASATPRLDPKVAEFFEELDEIEKASKALRDKASQSA